jgi:O-antigen biosynthesis protein WbqP
MREENVNKDLVNVDPVNSDGSKEELNNITRDSVSLVAYDRYVKRLIDIILSGVGILICAIPLAIIAIIIKIDSPGPVIFKQKRVGINKTHFQIMKFRSMYVDDSCKDIPTHLLKDPEARITKVGKFLRKTSLDELPQLFNIFKGDMAIVGPRPALWNQFDLIAERDKYGANNVRPGLTGWAQINGRDELEIDIKAKLDGEYIEKESLWFDIKCFLGTIVSVAKSDGVVEGGTNQMVKESDK